MNLKYWEWEASAFKDKMKNPSIKHLTSILFENETQAYRFAITLGFVKKKKYAKLKDFPQNLPKATWLRYLEYGVQLGMLDKSSNGVYELTNRFSNPLRNLSDFYKKWREIEVQEDLDLSYPRAKKQTFSNKQSSSNTFIDVSNQAQMPSKSETNKQNL